MLPFRKWISSWVSLLGQDCLKTIKFWPFVKWVRLWRQVIFCKITIVENTLRKSNELSSFSNYAFILWCYFWVHVNSGVSLDGLCRHTNQVCFRYKNIKSKKPHLRNELSCFCKILEKTKIILFIVSFRKLYFHFFCKKSEYFRKIFKTSLDSWCDVFSPIKQNVTPHWNLRKIQYIVPKKCSVFDTCWMIPHLILAVSNIVYFF